MTKRKISIIGVGSAQFSGGIIRDLCVTPNLHDKELVLMDVDESRLNFITNMGKNWRKNFMLALILVLPRAVQKHLKDRIM